MKQSILKIHLPLFAAQLFFSTIPVAAKLAFKSFTPEAVVFFRIAGSGLLFFILFTLFFRERIVKKRHLLYFAMYGFFGVVCNQYLFVKGVSFTSSINASVLISTIPIFTIVFAVLMKKETVNFIKIFGVVTALAGVWMLLGFGKFEFAGYVKGNIMILMNSASFAFYLVISKPMLKIYKPFTVMTYMYLFSTVEILPLTIKNVTAIPYLQIVPADYLPLYVIVLFGTFLPYLINKLVLQKTLSSVVAIYTYIQPVVGSVLAMIFLGEALSVKIVFASLLILAGVTFVSFHRLISLPNLFQFKSGFRN